MDSVISLTIFLDSEPTSWVSENLGTITITIISSLIIFAFFLGGINKSIISLNKSVKDIPSMQSDIEANKKTAGISDKTLEKIDDKIDKMIDRFDKIILSSISRANSPIRLNESGTRILKQSKIADVIQEKYKSIVEQVKAKDPQNAYQTQEVLFDVVAGLGKDETLIEKLENGAFLSGSDVSTVLYAGAIDIRDQVVKDMGYMMWDIDKEQAEPND